MLLTLLDVGAYPRGTEIVCVVQPPSGGTCCATVTRAAVGQRGGTVKRDLLLPEKPGTSGAGLCSSLVKTWLRPAGRKTVQQLLIGHESCDLTRTAPT